MKNNVKRFIAVAALATVLVATGCASSSGQSSAASSASSASSSAEVSSASSEAATASYSIEAPAPAEQAGEWRTDDPATQENNIVKLVSSELKDGKFVATYEPVNDGTTSVNLKHYTGPACDMLYTYTLTVENGQIKEEGEPVLTKAPDENAIDPFLSGDWADDEKQLSTLHVEKNPDGGWNAEATTAATQGAHVLKMTLYYDCDLQKLVYADGKAYDAPVSDSAEEELGDPVATDKQGIIEIASTDDDQVSLYWNAEANGEGRDITFLRSDGNNADYADFQKALSGVPSDSTEQDASDEAADAEEDGQNPVMNFIGPYACDRASMMVNASGSEDAAITIDWGSSAAESSQWVLSGHFDMDTLTVSYSNAVKTNYVYNPDGSVKSQEVEYSDGSGRIVFHNGDSLSCTWENENEPDNGAMEFTWNF